jgi:hypothetical protein
MIIVAAYAIAALLLIPATMTVVLGYRPSELTVHNERWLLRDRIDPLLRQLDRRFGSRWLPPASLFIFCGLAHPWTSWQAVDPVGAVRAITTAVAAIVAWKAATIGVNLVLADTRVRARIVTVVAAVLVWWHPVALVVLLNVSINDLHGWEHHRHMPLRVLFAVLSFSLVCGLAGASAAAVGVALPQSSGAALFVVLVVATSHYVIPAIGKLRTGMHPFDWMLENRFDCIAACAFSWGWRRDRSEAQAVRLSRIVRRLNPVFGVLTAIAELSTAFALVDVRVAIAALLAVTAMHLGIVALAGLFFWEYAATCTAMATVLFVMSGDPGVAGAFSIGTAAAALLAMWLSVYILKLWRPWPVSWWDGPFATVTEMVAVGDSGIEYGLEAGGFGPNARAFARTFGHAYCDQPIIQAHPGSRIDSMDSHDGEIEQPGGVREHAHPKVFRDALIATGGDPTQLAAVKQRYGRLRCSAERAEYCDRFLIAHFRALNAGGRISMLPERLMWLGAPVGQHYRFAQAEPYRGQEPVRSLVLRVREEFYTGDRFVSNTRTIREISIE